MVFSLALATFAAWRGVSVARFGADVLDASGAVRWNALACGVFFVLLGLVFQRAGFKAHFEPVAVHLGWLLVLGGLASGLGEENWLVWAGALVLVGAGLAVGAFRFRRFPLFAYGVIGGYLGLTRFIFEGDETLGCFWMSFSAIVIVLGLVFAQRRMKEPLE